MIFEFETRRPVRDRRTDGRIGKTRNTTYQEGRVINGPAMSRLSAADVASESDRFLNMATLEKVNFCHYNLSEQDFYRLGAHPFFQELTAAKRQRAKYSVS